MSSEKSGLNCLLNKLLLLGWRKKKQWIMMWCFNFSGIPIFQTSKGNENWFEKLDSLRNWGENKCSTEEREMTFDSSYQEILKKWGFEILGFHCIDPDRNNIIMNYHPLTWVLEVWNMGSISTPGLTLLLEKSWSQRVSKSRLPIFPRKFGGVPLPLKTTKLPSVNYGRDIRNGLGLSEENNKNIISNISKKTSSPWAIIFIRQYLNQLNNPAGLTPKQQKA